MNLIKGHAYFIEVLHRQVDSECYLMVGAMLLQEDYQYLHNKYLIKYKKGKKQGIFQ